MIHTRVPATVANFGPAFDALAVAVTLYNDVRLDRDATGRVEIDGEGRDQLPRNETNLVHRAAVEVARRIGRDERFFVRCVNRIPIGRGLGSSAAAIVGGAVAANELFGGKLTPADLLDLAWRLEGHPDNVAAALFGGCVLTCGTDGRVDWTRVNPSWTVALVVAVPEFAVSTVAARAALPERVPLRDAAANLGRTGGLVTAMLTGRTDLLPTAMEDSLHQPYRRALVPGFDDVIASAKAAGAYSAALCGSGSSIVAVAPPEVAAAVGKNMVEAFSSAGNAARYLILDIDLDGARVVTED
ncbi:MAG TPA: homoserine kinase [bacterium]|nr:homoserine kinase [bacterium]